MNMVRLLPSVLSRLVPAAFALLVVEALAQPVVENASFEADAVPPGPGYGAITGWTAVGEIGTSYGINEAGGAFADNGAIPHGTKVAFLQHNGGLGQDVFGFTVGAQYRLTYRENARSGCCGGTATLSVVVGGSAVVGVHFVTVVGGTNPYRTVGSDVFSASASTLPVVFLKEGEGDVTALIDDVQIVEVPANTPPTIALHPQPQVLGAGDAVRFTGAAVGTIPLFYQWQFDGKPLAGETNRTLTFSEAEPGHAGGYSFVVTNMAGSATSSVATLTVRTGVPRIVNPSFEADALPPFPGYGPITGWHPGGGIGTSYGLNLGTGPFADNGAIPDGAKAAFMQNNGTLSQTVSGFTVGAQYWLSYRENARANCCGERVATMSVIVGGTTVVPEHVVAIVGGENPFRFVASSVFTAPETTLTISFTKGGTGDSTALIDDVRIAPPLELGIALEEGNASAILVKGVPGRTIMVEFKNSLAPGTGWEALTNFTLTSGSAVVVDSGVPASNPRFYRARQAP